MGRTRVKKHILLKREFLSPSEPYQWPGTCWLITKWLDYPVFRIADSRWDQFAAPTRRDIRCSWLVSSGKDLENSSTKAHPVGSSDMRWEFSSIFSWVYWTTRNLLNLYLQVPLTGQTRVIPLDCLQMTIGNGERKLASTWYGFLDNLLSSSMIISLFLALQDSQAHKLEESYDPRFC